jgi:hypothetical protein
MADDAGLEDERDTRLPSSALSPAEYRNFRTLVAELVPQGVDNDVSLYTVRGFLSTFNGVTDATARQVRPRTWHSYSRLLRLCLARRRESLLGKDTSTR